MNLSEFQLQCGMNEFPKMPIRGNAGTNRGTETCAEFYLQLLRAFGKLWNLDT